MEAPAIKRRATPVVASNLRKRRAAEEEEAEENGADEHNEEEEHRRVARLRAVQGQQEGRAPKRGVSLETLAQSEKPHEKPRKAAEPMFGSQFSVTVDHGLGVSAAHEKLMEQFISDKLGLNKPEPTKDKPKRPDDDIYQLPDELKVGESADDGVVTAAWSTGIAEVALPAKFKERNVQLTEAAAHQKLETEELQAMIRRNANSVGFNRFHVEDATFPLVPSAPQPAARAAQPSASAAHRHSFREFKKTLYSKQEG